MTIYLFQDPRFNSDIDVQMAYKTRSILCMAIKDSDGEVIGVAQAINKISVRDEPFDEHDEKVRGGKLSPGSLMSALPLYMCKIVT